MNKAEQILYDRLVNTPLDWKGGQKRRSVYIADIADALYGDISPNSLQAVNRQLSVALRNPMFERKGRGADAMIINAKDKDFDIRSEYGNWLDSEIQNNEDVIINLVHYLNETVVDYILTEDACDVAIEKFPLRGKTEDFIVQFWRYVFNSKGFKQTCDSIGFMLIDYFTIEYDETASYLVKSQPESLEAFRYFIDSRDARIEQHNKNMKFKKTRSTIYDDYKNVLYYRLERLGDLFGIDMRSIPALGYRQTMISGAGMRENDDLAVDPLYQQLSRDKRLCRTTRR